MICYPTLVSYIEIFLSLRGSLRSLSSFEAVTDGSGSLVYSVSGGMAWFSVVDSDLNRWFMGVFLNNSSRERFSLKPFCRLFERELLFEDSGESYYLDLVLRSDSSDPSLVRSVCLTLVEDDGYLRGEGYVPFCDSESGKWGFDNLNEGSRIAPQWCSVTDFVEGRAVVECHGKFGLIDGQGDLVVPSIYDEVSWDGSRYAYVDLEGLWGVFSRTGECLSVVQWDWMGEYSNGYALVQRGDKYGFIDSLGALVIEPIYDDAGSFNKFGSAQVSIGKEKFFIDHLQRRV